MQESWNKVICRGHASCPGWSLFTYKWSYNSADSNVDVSWYNAEVTGPTITWPTYATPHLCIDSISQTKKFYAFYRAVAKQAVSLDRQLAKKDYLQINVFLAGGGGVEKNLEVSQIKATLSLSGRAIGGTLSSINESLSGSHRAEQWREIGLPGCSRPDSWDINISLSIDPLLLRRNLPVVEWSW